MPPLRSRPHLRTATTLLLIASLGNLAPLRANPAGEVVRHGDVQFERADNQLRILQASRKAIIDWEAFSISAGESTEFVQPDSKAAALNRVRGLTASQIDGALKANGRLFLLNPNGIIIGPGGTVDVAGFVASTLDVTDAEFLADGDLNFRGGSEAAVINLGSISAFEGDVILIANEVENSGRISAPGGTVGLAAGSDVLVQAAGDERIFVRAGNGSVTNHASGVIEGAVAELKAYHGNVYGMAVKNEGRVAATGVAKKGGQIFLSANGGKVSSSGTLSARNADRSGGDITIDAGPEGQVEIGGRIDASGDAGTGGTVVILGREIDLLASSLILSDGVSGGGSLFIGGGVRGDDPLFHQAENVRVAAGAQLSASATGSGNGGSIVLSARDRLEFNGVVTATGGRLGGDGGFVELSGENTLSLPGLAGRVDLSADLGLSGLLLIDPNDILVLDGVTVDAAGITGSPVNDNTLYDQDIADFLEFSGSLVIETSGTGGNGDITTDVGTDITWTSGNNLTFNADRDFIHQGSINASGGSGGIAVNAARSISLESGSSLSVGDGNLALTANPSESAPGDFTGITLDAAVVQTGGQGNIGMMAHGGGVSAWPTFTDGIRLENGSQVESLSTAADAGTITLWGHGSSAPGTDSNRNGVTIEGGSSLLSHSGDISITGIGGTGSGGANRGINMSQDSEVQSLGTGADAAEIILSGTGGSGGGSGNSGIRLSGYSTDINAVDGGISLTGLGGGDGSGAENHGVIIENLPETISSSGTGPSVGPISITGTGGNGTSSNIGVLIRGFVSVETVDADVSITGTGGNGTGDHNSGIFLSDYVSILSSGIGATAGGIKLIGSGGSGVSNNVGIHTQGFGNLLSTIDGDIELSGTGGGQSTGIRNRGLLLDNGMIDSSGVGSIDLEGLGGAGISEIDGIQMENGFSTQVDSGTLSITGAAGGTLGIGVNATSSNGMVAVTGSGAIEITGTGTGSANGVDFQNSSETIGGAAASSVQLSSLGGNLLLNSPIIANGDVALSSKAGLIQQQAVTSSAGQASFSGNMISVEAPVGAAGLITFDIDDQGSATNGTVAINDILTPGTGLTFSGGAGTGDTVTYQGYTGPPIALSIDDFTGIENLIGPNAPGDLLKGPNPGAAFTFGGPDQFSVSGIAVTQFENVDGGPGDDSFAFGPGSSLSGNLDGGGGSNTLDYASFGAPLNLNFQTQAATSIAGGAANGMAQINDFIGSGAVGAGGDFFTGPDTGTTFVIDAPDTFAFNAGAVTVTGVANLTGGSGIDVFSLQDGGSLSGNLVGGGAVNTLAYAFSAGSPVTVNYQEKSATGIFSGGINGFAEITDFSVASDPADLFIGPDTTTTFDLVGNDTWAFQDGSTPIDVIGFANFQGGGGIDTFRVSSSGSLSGNLAGGGAANILDFDQLNYGTPILIDLAGASATGFGGTISEISGFIGDSGWGNAFAGPNADSTYTVTGSDTFDLDGVITGTHFANLSGGSMNDSFAIQSTGSLSGQLDGGGGNNTLDYASFGTSTLLNFETRSAPGIFGEAPSGFSNLQNFIGNGTPGPGGDTFIGPDTATTYLINGADDFRFNGGAIKVFNFANLIGGAGVDAFNLTGNGSLSGQLTGTGSSNSLNYPGYSTAVTVNYPIKAATGLFGGNSSGFADITDFSVSSDPADLFIGPNAGTAYQFTGANTWDFLDGATPIGVTGFANLLAGPGNDTFEFVGVGSSLSGQLDGGAGNNTLDFSAYGASTSVNFQDQSATALFGGAASGFSNLQDFIGNGIPGITGDTFTGPDVPSTFLINGADTFSFSAGAITVTNFANLTGGSANDVFDLESAGSLSGQLNGGGGNNTLDYASFGASTAVNFEARSASALRGGAPAGFSNLQNFIGNGIPGASGDTFTGPDAPTTFLITGADTFSFNAGSINVTAFANLVGGADDDTFDVESTGSLSGQVDGGGGNNTLDYASFGTSTTVNFQDRSATALFGGTASGFSNLQDFIGNGIPGAPGDTFIGPDAATTFLIDGPDTFHFNAGAITVTAFANLVGGSGIDAFDLTGSGTLSGQLIGTGGTNSLNYPNYGTPVTVDYQNRSATGLFSGNPNGFADITDFSVSSDPADLFIGPDAPTLYQLDGPNDWTFLDGPTTIDVLGFANFQGGPNPDTFALGPGASLSGQLTGGPGSPDNTLDFTNFGSPVFLDVQEQSVTGIFGGNPNGFSQINRFLGSGDPTDLVTGFNANSDYNVTGPDTFDIDGLFTFINFANLAAGPGDNLIKMHPAGSLSGQLDGGEGRNALSYETRGAPSRIDFASMSATGLFAGAPDGFARIQDFIGSGATGLGGDLFIGPAAATTFDFDGGDDFRFPFSDPEIGPINITATNFPNLTAGAGADLFRFNPGSSLTGLLQGTPGGANSLDFGPFGSAVEVDLGARSATPVNRFENIRSFNGSNQSDTMIGTGGNDSFTISADNAGTVGANTFTSFEKLDGEGGNDQFTFLNQATVESVDGNGGTGDRLTVNDRNLRGTNTYDIFEGQISRNPTYNFQGIEAIELLLGSGDDTVNTRFTSFEQFLDAGTGDDLLNFPTAQFTLDPFASLPGFGTVNFENFERIIFAAGQILDIGTLLQQQTGQDPNAFPGSGQGPLTQFSPGFADLANQLLSLQASFASSALTSQVAVILADPDGLTVFQPFSIDGSGLSPSQLAVEALTEALSPQANSELFAALGMQSSIFLFLPDGPFAIDLSGVPIDPILNQALQTNLGFAAAMELLAALQIPFVFTLVSTDGVAAIDGSGDAPSPPTVVLLTGQLSDEALAELTNALAGGQ